MSDTLLVAWLISLAAFVVVYGLVPYVWAQILRWRHRSQTEQDSSPPQIEEPKEEVVEEYYEDGEEGEGWNLARSWRRFWSRDGDEPVPREPRYANATVLHPWTRRAWAQYRPFRLGQLALLRVDIGAMSASSQVEEPVPFPDRHLPAGDLTIDVVISSVQFTVRSAPTGIMRPIRFPQEHAATRQLIVPGDGGPARAADGDSFLTFLLGAPRISGSARLRIAYYFRDAVVQSQLLTARIREPVRYRSHPLAWLFDRLEDRLDRDRLSAWSLVTDYTISASLPGIVDIPSRPRVAVMLNGNEGGHEIYVRAPGLSGVERSVAAGTAAPADPVSLPPAISDKVRTMRRTLAGEPVAPTKITQSPTQLVNALRAIAPLGWDLYAALFPGMRDILYSLEGGTNPVVLHVARPAGVTLSVPWALIYTTSIDSKYGPGYEKVPVCPLVKRWDGSTDLVSGGETHCPYSDAVSHTADLLCPFGFLGFRHEIEQLNSTQRPVLTIKAASGSRVVIAETAYQVSGKALQQHVASLRQAFARLPGVDIEEASSKDLLKQLICGDLPLIYFFCHGERPRADSRETYLGIGNRELLTAPDFEGWVKEAFVERKVRVWDQIRPLVFINACHSAELDPAALFNYIDAFVGAANAAGVIGTEVKVSQDLAMEFARSFFDELLIPGATVGTAMRGARLAFLSKGNLFGLNYTPYCWADLTLTPGRS